MRSAVGLKQMKFTSSLAVLDDHSVIQAGDGPVFTGPPSLQIDREWADLLLGEGQMHLFNFG
jgi:hypothetical protein